MEKNCGVPTSVPSELTSVLLHGNARVALRENACSRSLCWDQRSGRMRCGLSGTWTFFIGCLMFVAGAGVSIYVNYPLVSYEDFIVCYSHDGYGDFFAEKKDCNYEYSAKNFLHGTRFKASSP